MRRALAGTVGNVASIEDQAVLPTLSSRPHSMAPSRLFVSRETQPQSHGCTADVG